MPFKSRERGSRPDVVWDRVPYLCSYKGKNYCFWQIQCCISVGEKSVFALTKYELIVSTAAFLKKIDEIAWSFRGERETERNRDRDRDRDRDRERE